MLKKIFEIVSTRKLTFVIVLIVLAAVGYWTYGKIKGNVVETKYVLASAAKETLIASISGSGQVSVVNQVDVKAKASGEIINVSVKNGQAVRTGATLVSLDSKDVQKTVRDAELSLESAQIALKKLKKPADEYSLLQTQNALVDARDKLEKLKSSQPVDYQDAKDAKQKAQDNLDKAYEDAFNDVADAFLDLPTVITQLNTILFGTGIVASETTVNSSSDNSSALINSIGDADDISSLQIFQSSATKDYNTAKSKYDTNFASYKKATRYSDNATIETLLTETLDDVKSIAQAGKSASNYLDTWSEMRTKKHQSVFAKVTEYKTSLATYIGQVNGHLTALIAMQRTLQDDKEALTTAENNLKEMDQNNPLDLAAAQATVKEKEISLADLKAGATSLDIRSQAISVKQKQNALADAKEKLVDYSIRAPFDGMIAKVSVKKGDTTSAGTVAVTLITRQRTAEISLNEVDVAKVKVGQKATLTFDAITNLSITGEVVDIDTLGTVSQGVVNYNVKIVFDTQDDRVKPGMSVSAAIITDVKQDVIAVPNSAVKSQGDMNYVEMLGVAVPQDQASQGVVSATAPSRQQVEVGIANDTSTEIISGLKEGDQVVMRTVTSQATTAPTTPSLFGGGNRVGGGGAPGAGAVRRALD